VTPALAAFRERLHARLPGLAGALEGALKPTPAHRIQRTPPLRDALRALMAGYSFTSILDDTRGFLDPLLETAHVPAPEVQDPNDDTEVDAPRPPSPAPTVPLPRHDDATIPAEDVPEEYAPARVEESGMDDDFTLPYAEGGTHEADRTPDDDDDTPIVPVDAPWAPPTLAAQPPPTPGDDAWPSLPRREAPRVPRSPALRLAAPAGLSALGRAVPEMDRPPVSPAPTLPLPAVAPPPHPPEEEPAVIPAPPRRNWTLWAVAALLAITVVTVGTARHVVSGTQDGPVANAPSVIPPILPDATTLASALKGLTDGAHLSDAQIGAAARGVLAPADVTALLTPTLLTAPGRAGRALVLVDAQRKGDTSTEAAVLAELLRLPEKKIEPEWWIAEGRLRANRQDWPGAMDALFSIPMAAGLDPWSRAGLLEVRAAAAMGTAKDDAARASARANWTALAEFARQNNLPDVAARAEARSR
jgi:hypothetical protein